jgi:hypothetical protein
MGLFVGAHFAVASGQFGDFQLLEALLLRTGFGFALPANGLSRLPGGLIRFFAGRSGLFIAQGGGWRSGRQGGAGQGRGGGRKRANRQ